MDGRFGWTEEHLVRTPLRKVRLLRKGQSRRYALPESVRGSHDERWSGEEVARQWMDKTRPPTVSHPIPRRRSPDSSARPTMNHQVRVFQLWQIVAELGRQASNRSVPTSPKISSWVVAKHARFRF